MGHVGDVILIFQPYYQILCILKHIEDVEDRSSTLMGCSAMYVKDGKRSFGKLRLRTFQLYQILCMLKHVEDVEGQR